MYVACPACKSVYVIQPAHLRAAGGELRCGNCGARFNATAAVYEDPQQALDYAQQQQQRVSREIDELVDRALGEVPGGDRAADVSDADLESAPAAYTPTASVPQGVTAGATEGSAVAAEKEVELFSIQSDRDFYAQPLAVEFGTPQALPERSPVIDTLPYLLDDEVTQGLQISWGALAASLVLMLLLGVQYAWQQRYPLAKIDSLRPAMEQFCLLMQCDLPLRREPQLVEMIGREVRDHPAVAGALLISASFVNRAAFPQAYPVFQISFTDVSGTQVAMRRFAPLEYLEDARLLPQGMKSGEQAHVTLEVIDPGARAVSFQFEFL